MEKHRLVHGDSVQASDAATWKTLCLLAQAQGFLIDETELDFNNYHTLEFFNGQILGTNEPEASGHKLSLTDFIGKLLDLDGELRTRPVDHDGLTGMLMTDVIRFVNMGIVPGKKVIWSNLEKTIDPIRKWVSKRYSSGDMAFGQYDAWFENCDTIQVKFPDGSELSQQGDDVIRAGDRVRRVSGGYNGMKRGDEDEVVRISHNVKLKNFGEGHSKRHFIKVYSAATNTDNTMIKKYDVLEVIPTHLIDMFGPRILAMTDQVKGSSIQCYSMVKKSSQLWALNLFRKIGSVPDPSIISFTNERLPDIEILDMFLRGYVPGAHVRDERVKDHDVGTRWWYDKHGGNISCNAGGSYTRYGLDGYNPILRAATTTDAGRSPGTKQHHQDGQVSGQSEGTWNGQGATGAVRARRSTSRVAAPIAQAEDATRGNTRQARVARSEVGNPTGCRSYR